ncbi:unnamed protein product [Dovyalis caffra]|uniref:Metallo-beta-lactamase domain-containing protein n=1 Tax=Dovyalis caffra TaxID=77055 RepID=A0AAV1QZR4_9ROSI|nr:unnamed protein product [Dovyalis caffra]
MATYNLALILENPLNDAEFLLVKQTPPPKYGIEEYDSFVDSDLWDLPSKKLDRAKGELEPGSIVIEGIERINLGKFDFDSAIKKVLEQVGFKANDGGEWRFLKHVEEAEFGPGLPVNTVDRVGTLVVLGLINDSVQSSEKVNTALHYQEYPPGVILVPMKSRTSKPFHTTNLVIFAPENVKNESEDYNFVARGDALIVDPGCQANFHEEACQFVTWLLALMHFDWSSIWLDQLLKIVAALSKKLVVFVTHHHADHVDGLSVIQKCNPNATLLAHENTMCRISKDDWSLGHISVSGGEDICIGGQRLNVIFAPGHTDGHLALLHVDTHSLIVGDHCVGQGSALLDIASGGNMTGRSGAGTEFTETLRVSQRPSTCLAEKGNFGLLMFYKLVDYFQSTYRFIELAPHVLIPMHGRINLWPKNMLCGYLKNRRSRELSILAAIENGAKTLIDIVANVYSGVDRSLWVHAASNVRLHVDHLAQQNKLPKDFSVDTFNCSLVAFAEKVAKIEPK